MPPSKNTRRRSVFQQLGLTKTISDLVSETQALYKEDTTPWVVGYSGGKDSTAALQLVWLALRSMPREERTKPVHVISTDTLVENPVVAAWVKESLDAMREHAKEDGVPIVPHRLTPRLADTFWVNLIGRGYPAPRHKFRWCTIRLKIAPSNDFISDLIRKQGSAILVLGIRKAESSARAHSMSKLEARRFRARLSPNASLANSHIYSPIEDWSNDDVWLFLMQTPNPWGYDNKQLLTMYQGASQDGECPLVIDTNTPSCGSSRFGCWVCTLVDKDRSMQAMIQNDAEKEWMLPLLELRNELDTKNDRHLRDFRRMTGSVQLFHGRPIHGPYKQDMRERWLRRVLEAQRAAHEAAPLEVGEIRLISLDELSEIRRIWVVEKHELEDSLPRIYEEVVGKPFPDARLDDAQVFGLKEMQLLESACGGDELHFHLIRELLHVEWSMRAMMRRAGLFERLEQAFQRSFYVDAADAVERERRRQESLNAAKEGLYVQHALPFVSPWPDVNAAEERQ